jgi:FixJ family two-component response regulator
VIDLKLNGAVGTKLLAQIRDQGFRQPAVLISGWDVDSLDKIAQQSGFSAFVRKPMMNTSIVDLLEQLLSPP